MGRWMSALPLSPIGPQGRDVGGKGFFSSPLFLPLPSPGSECLGFFVFLIDDKEGALSPPFPHGKKSGRSTPSHEG